MTVDMLRKILAWSALLNMGILLWWFLIFTMAHDRVYRIHSRFINIPVERFNTIHYAGMTFYKIVIFSFFVMPYLALRIIT